MSIAEEIRESVSMWDVLDAIEIDYQEDGSGQAWIPAWTREERTPSVHINDRFWFDFGTGEGGDVFDFLMETQNVDFKGALRVLTRLDTGGLSITSVKPRPPKKKELIDFTDRIDMLPSVLEASEWLEAKIHEKWELSLFNLSQWDVRIGPGDSLVVPHRNYRTDEANLVRVRNLTPGAAKPKLSYKGSTATCLYSRSVSPSPFVLCEGESDAWTMDMMLRGVIPVRALPTGAGTVKPEWFVDPETPMLVFADDDKAGDHMSQLLLGSFPNVTRAGLPPFVADVNEAWKAGWTARVSVDGQRSWHWRWERLDD